ncbi:MAG: peptide ABC transporter ATP-binding protein, partial [Geminicoccaceae bacterium]
MSGAGAAPAPILEIDGLEIGFRGEGGVTPVGEGVGLALPAGGTLGLVGESGCGQSLTARAVMRLLPEP